MSNLKLLPKKEQILILYNNGLSIAQISREIGEYEQSITNLLKYLNVYKTTKPKQGNIRYFENIDTPIKAYLLGFITADGCIQNNGNNSFGLSITIHSKDRIIVDKLKEEIGCENKISHLTTLSTHNQQPKDHVRFALFNNFLYNDIKSYGIEPKKSTTMPNIILNIPKEYRKQFILGYFDGDGSISLPTFKKYKIFNSRRFYDYRYGKMNSTQIQISFRGTKEFLQGIADELELTNFMLFKDKKANCWSLKFNKKSEVLKFYNIYSISPFYLQRKHEKFIQRIN